EADVRGDVDLGARGESEVDAAAVPTDVVVRIDALIVEQVAADVIGDRPGAPAHRELGLLMLARAIDVALASGAGGERIAAGADLERVPTDRLRRSVRVRRRFRGAVDAPVGREAVLPILKEVLSSPDREVPAR